MPPTTRVLSQGEPMQLGAPDAPLSFERPARDRPAGEGPGLRRLRLDGKDAFDLSFWCGTCPLVFERLEGSNRTLSSEDLQARLNAGLSMIDNDVLGAASLLVPDATYLPMLLAVRPKLVMPSGKSDYFAHEQVAHRGIDSFWGLPQYPKTPYYRAGSWQPGDHDFLFEFIVPMLPPTWNDRDQVARYEQQLRSGAKPTILALSILDRTQPFDSFDAHSGLMHFVLDGHHKLEAAARLKTEITILSLLSIDDSLALRDDVQRIPELIESRPKRL
ncbi:hypothetical protein [Salinibacterium sp.]|uniref:hypothetical protein n=1 Tax=Salinibacterium sp. TaxID=1915057 RepID=UPI00286B952F|nr:hypothetical protein [Salinibacterium sp.]